MPHDDDQVDLGGWSAEDVEQAASDPLQTGWDHGIDAPTRFKLGVVGAARARAATAAGQDPRTLSVFVLAPESEDLADGPREPMLDAGMTPLAGKIWFVNGVVISGRSLALPSEDPAALFAALTNDMGLGHVPAVVVDSRSGSDVLRFYPRGVQDPDAREIVRTDCSDVTLDEIREVVDSVYKNCLVTPDAQPQGNRLWKDSKKQWPARDAEHRVQAYLKSGLAAAFSSCVVYHEVPGTTGRVDLQLEEPDPADNSKRLHLAVLELKVLRSFGDTGTPYSTADNHGAVEKGVKQAAAYRIERGHRIAALCCFDMRKDDEGDGCFDAVKDLAASQEVSMHRCYLYSSSDAYRDALVATAPV